MGDVIVNILAGVGALTILSAFVLGVLTARETAVARRVDARLAQASEAQRSAEVELQFWETVARTWPPD
jgi:hypothetical protein